MNLAEVIEEAIKPTRDRICNEICKYNSDLKIKVDDMDGAEQDAFERKYCMHCPIVEELM